MRNRLRELAEIVVVPLEALLLARRSLLRLKGVVRRVFAREHRLSDRLSPDRCQTILSLPLLRMRLPCHFRQSKLAAHIDLSKSPMPVRTTMLSIPPRPETILPA